MDKFRKFEAWFGLVGVVVGFLLMFFPSVFGTLFSEMPWMHLTAAFGMLLGLVLLKGVGMLNDDLMKYAVWVVLALVAWPFVMPVVQSFSLMHLGWLVVAVSPLVLSVFGWGKFFHS